MFDRPPVRRWVGRTSFFLVPHRVSVSLCVVGERGVAGWNTIVLRGLDRSGRRWWWSVSLAHCWVLRGHLCVWCFSVPLLGWLSNAWVFCVVAVVGFGVWLCVECCIVDASILLWSSV